MIGSGAIMCEELSPKYRVAFLAASLRYQSDTDPVTPQVYL